MAFGVPSWVLQNILTEKSVLKINILYVRKQKCYCKCDWKCTFRFLCHPLAVGPGCKGQGAKQGMTNHPEGRAEGRHSAWRGLMSASHLRNK